MTPGNFVSELFVYQGVVLVLSEVQVGLFLGFKKKCFLYPIFVPKMACI